jgi:flavin reductase (DIM6/NTAB) family NADH-FMN oxidoreductase RutF
MNSLNEFPMWQPDELLDASAMRKAFACFPTGVTALCARGDNGQPVGLTASSFTTVSLDPALVSVCIAHTSTTWPRLSAVERVGVSVLARHHEKVASALASNRPDRFSEVDWASSPTGAVFIHDSTLWLECTINQTVRAGDHDVVLLRIVNLRSDPNTEPMVFHRSRFRWLTTT